MLFSVGNPVDRNPETMHRSLPKKHAVVRCPKRLFRTIERICRGNRLTYTRFVNMALYNFAVENCEQQAPYPGIQLPPPPREPRNYYI